MNEPKYDAEREFQERYDLVEELWEEHKSARFPRGFGGMDVNGVDFVMLDADVAGCIGAFLERRTLDVWRACVLGVYSRKCEGILHILNEAGMQYFWRVGRMAELVLEAVQIAERPEHREKRV